MKRFDALVIGGGPAGSTAAFLLASSGWSVALVEKSAFPRRKVCGEYLSATNYPVFGRLGILEEFLGAAGPEIRRVELVWRSTTVTAKMPQPASSHAEWGRALRRERLDSMLLGRAAEAGAEVWQPFSAVDVRRDGEILTTRILSKTTGEAVDIESGVVIAAHNSWGVGSLPTQLGRLPVRGSDLLAFKTYLEGSNLPRDVMNMLVFPGGYAGMVNCDGGLTSFSFCIRRDHLDALRLKRPHEKAGKVVYEHIVETCPGIERVLPSACPDLEWLSTGPIRPGIRERYRGGIFLVGNAAGEAHPTIADGISMAIQSACMLARLLGERRTRTLTEAELRGVAREYDRAWLRAFRLRIRAAGVFAALALAGRTHRLLLPFVRAFPQSLTFGARLGGLADEVA